MYGDCPECKRLSENFAEAAKTYFEILAKSRLAQIENNSLLVSALESLKLAATERRAIGRFELRRHEATHPKAKAQTA